jgi:hypothetical protein
MRSTPRQLRSWGVAVTAVLCAGCSPKWLTTNTPRTSIQQLIGSEATERALNQLSIPDLWGMKVLVDVASPAAKEDQTYLRQALAAKLAARGAVIADAAAADVYRATALAGALGTTESDSFVGLPALQHPLLPLASPELAVYKSTLQQGYARLELLVRDPNNAGVIYHSGPVIGVAFWKDVHVLFLSFHNTDTDEAQAVASAIAPSQTYERTSRWAPGLGKLGTVP